ncbi:MAG: hypothetical protein IKF18_07215 [Erysipelotrichaceae bacterium]|nr:hypothetical protein [Erysipelotrichaceae bacterium]
MGKYKYDESRLVFYRTKSGRIACFDPQKRKFNVPKDTHFIPKQMIKNYNPGKGRVTLATGVNKDCDEARAAEWFLKYFGGDIVVLKTKSDDEENVKQPDFLINGEYWDLKTNVTPTENAIHNAISKGAKQIRKDGKPGGLIIDILEKGIRSDSIISFIIADKLRQLHISGIFVVVKKGDEIIDVVQKD